jgi:tripartite-type tricarboxylate transporter receptor subunit TctC
MTSIRFVARCLTVFAATAGFSAAFAQSSSSYPSGQLRIVVPYPAGGGTDIFARMLGQKLNESWGQPVVVDNRAGANGTVGTAYVAKAPADGLTLLIVPAGYAANPGLYKQLPYDQTRELTGVTRLASGPLVLVVHPSVPAKTAKELIALARSHPGEINFGSAGSGSLPHLSGELFSLMAGIKLVHIPYKGAGAAVTDLVGGRVPVYFMNVLQSLQLIKTGRLRALGVTTPERSPIAPEIPTIAESGLAGFDMTNWYGMLAPAATPRDVIVKLNAEVVRHLQLQELKNKLADDGMAVVASSPEQFNEFLQREMTKYNRIIDKSGIKGTL